MISDLAADFEAPILTVHDCFGTQPNYIDVLQFRLKEEFIKLYVNNKFLNFFHKWLVQYIKDNNYETVKEKTNQYVILNNNSKLTLTDKVIIPKPPIKTV